MPPRDRHRASQAGRRPSLSTAFVCVLCCWCVVLYFYWRNLEVRAVLDEFYDAETGILREDMRAVSSVLNHDILPAMKGLEKSFERMKVTPTMPMFQLDGTDSFTPSTQPENTVRSDPKLKDQQEIAILNLKERLAHPSSGDNSKAGGQLRAIQHDMSRSDLKKAHPISHLSEVAKDPAEVHVAFSTDCSPFQDWQTLLVFHSGQAVGQQGPMTRIASGCDEAKKTKLTKLYQKLWPNYHVHFTPDFKKDAKTQKKYDFYNKPYGVQHWLDQADPPIESGTIIAIVDPDFVFLRPLTARMKGNNNNIVTEPVRRQDIFDIVSRGRPVGQQYGLGAPWVYDNSKDFNRTKICGEGSPCTKVPNHRAGSKAYSVGPPYILERDDLARLTKSWTKFVPLVYEGYPQLLAEMYAYSMAGAHEDLPHLRMDHFMVSNVDVSHGEGWKWVDQLDDVCRPPSDGVYFPGKPLPTFLHYCQFFRSREIGFQKRRVKKDIFSCEQDMLLEPPEDLGSATYMIRNGNREEMGPIARKRNGFALCVLHRSINAAALDYKQRMCEGNPNTSFNKTINVILNEKW